MKRKFLILSAVLAVTGLAFLPKQALAAHTLDALAVCHSTSLPTSNPVTLSLTTTSGDTVVVLMLAVTGSTARGGGTPTFNGVAMTQANSTQKAAVSPESSEELWYLLDPSIGTYNFSIPNSGAVGIGATAAGFKAASGKASALDVANGGNNTSVSPSVSLTTTVNGDAIAAGVATGATTWSPTGRSGTAICDKDDGSHGDGSQYLLQGTAGAQAMSWTFGTSDDWGEVAAAFKEVDATKLTDGANPGNSTIAPGGSITDVDGFTLTTSSGTDAITSVTVNLSSASGVGTLSITDGSNTVLGSIGGGTGSGISSGSNTISISSTNATTGGTAFKIRVTPLSHANMPAVPGASYSITAAATGWVGTNRKLGTSSDASSTVTIDNASPSDVTGATTTPVSGQITVSWTNPGDSDFSQVMVLRATSSISDIPAEGTSYSNGNTIGSSTVIYAGPATSTIDSGLVNGTTYYYKIFAADANGNYSTPGLQVSDTPTAGPVTITFSGIIYDSNENDPLLIAEPLKLAVASTTSYTATSSAADGTFSFSGVLQPATGTVMTIWLNTNGGDYGSLVTKYGSNCIGYPNCTGIKLFKSHVRISSRDGSAVSNSDLSACNNGNGSVCSDSDIGFTVSGGSLNVPDARTILRIGSPATFSPGGNISAQRLEVAGVYNGSNETITLSGTGTSLNCASDEAVPLCVTGTFNASSTSVSFTGAGTTTVPELPFYNLSIAPTSSTTTAYNLGGAPWYNNSWSYRKSVTIDHREIASSTAETYAYFPLLINFTDSNLKYSGSGGNVGKSDGTDILFTASDGVTKLNHEIESYASSTGQLTAWVNVGSGGLPTSTDSTIYMYYGNASAGDQSNKTGTWDANYKLAYHMGDSAAGKTILDSTSNANNGTNAANTNTRTDAGKIGQAIDFNGASDTVSTLYAPALATSSKITLEAWINASSTGSSPMAISKNTYAELGLSAATLKPVFTDNATSVMASAAISAGAWHYLAGVADGQSFLLYVDGVLTASASGTLVSESNAFYAGSRAAVSGFFPGTLDEIKISNTARSADWIQTGYNNQTSTGTFYSVGFQETRAFTVSHNLTIGDGSHAITVTPVNKSINVGGGLNIASGILDLSANNPLVSVSGSLNISGGTLKASATSPLTVTGDFTNNGTFTHNNGEVILNPAVSSTVSGASTAFYDLVSTSTGATIKFQAASANSPVFTFADVLSLAGNSGSYITVQSTSAGSQWLGNFSLSDQPVNYVKFSDAGCQPGTVSVNLPDGNINLSNNGGCLVFFVHGGGGGGGGNLSSNNVTGAGAGGNAQSGGDAGVGDQNSQNNPTGNSGGGAAVTGGGAGSGGGGAAP